jgi:photosystem II stability/assembly factor-like uncharacterized protein
MKKPRLLHLAALPLLGSLALAASMNLALQEAGPGDESAVADVPESEADTEKEAEKEAEKKPAKKRKARKRRAVQGTLPTQWVAQLPWRSIGPANMGGRITDLAVHPEDSSCYWVATASGGLLKTSNNGVDYEHQFDHEAVASVGSVAVSTSNPDIVWVGTGEPNPRNSVSWGDGVYKSVDGGATWEHMGLEGTFQISTVLIDPLDPDIVWVGALGRLWGPNEERGLFKTGDGGVTWEKVLFIDEDTGVIDVQMHPNDRKTLLAATYVRRRDEFDTNDPSVKWGEGAAIYKTTDGGATFRKLTEGLPSVTLGRIGLDYFAADPDVVFAIIESELITQEPENAAWMGIRSKDAEVGALLTDITEEGPADLAGLQEGDILLTFDGELVQTQRDLVKRMRRRVAGDTVEIEVSREHETVAVEVTFERRPEQEEDKKKGKKGEETEATDKPDKSEKDEASETKDTPPSPGPFSAGLGGQRLNVQGEQGAEGHEYGGVYRSSDGGESWTRVNSVNPRPMYFSEIRVDPSDANHLYVLGMSLYRSSDGGETFTADGGGNEVHVDHHALWIDPEDGRHMILGGDGGIYVTWDRMEGWDHHNHVAIGQFYDIAIGSRRDYRVFGGLQDNGTWGGPSRTPDGDGPTNSDWFNIGGGDGFVCQVDQKEPDLVYYESQNGGIGRTNLSSGERGYLRPRGTRGLSYRWNWKTPYILSAHNTKIVYSAGSFVFRSLDRGTGLRRISDEISRTDRGAATALAESPLDSEQLYVGTDDGALWATANGGTEWRDLFALNEPPPSEKPEEPEEAKPDAEGIAESDSVGAPGQGAASEAGGDRITGEWEAVAAGNGIESEADGTFLLSLSLSPEGKVTGQVQSGLGDGEVTDGTFDAETGVLRLECTSDEINVIFEAEVGENSMAGTIAEASGLYDYSFGGKRRSIEGTGESDVAVAIIEEETEDFPEAEPEPENKPENKPEDEPENEKKKKKARKHIDDTIDQLLPGRFHVSSIVCSRHGEGRVYVAFDGHRSDDDRPWVFVSEDGGTTWTSLRANLPDEAGSVRVVAEDPVVENLLFLGCEFGAFVSIDRGESWTRFGRSFPTVAVHDFAIHPTCGELVVGTHGRSIWITEIAALRQMSEEAVEADARLYRPSDPVIWRSQPRRGSSGSRSFTGENPPSRAGIFYSLRKKTRDVSLSITDLSGAVIRELEISGEKGLHRVEWDLRGKQSANGEGRRRRYARRVDPGTYAVVLRVGETTWKEPFEVRSDPGYPDPQWLQHEREREELQWRETLEVGERLDDEL